MDFLNRIDVDESAIECLQKSDMELKKEFIALSKALQTRGVFYKYACPICLEVKMTETNKRTCHHCNIKSCASCYPSRWYVLPGKERDGLARRGGNNISDRACAICHTRCIKCGVVERPHFCNS
jgi:uncharacterized Fe-S cluster-containing radical SAM superfamily enzyme